MEMDGRKCFQFRWQLFKTLIAHCALRRPLEHFCAIKRARIRNLTGATPECNTCCKVLQLLKLYAAGMDSLLPQHPSSCQKGLGHVLPVRLPTINVCERLTLIAAVPGSCSIKASGPLRQAPVILRRLVRGFSPL